MKPLTISDSKTILLALQGEIRRSQEARYYHRLHAMLLVAQGMTCSEVAKIMSDSPRAVQYWIRRFERDGFAGLADADRAGRPRRLSAQQIDIIIQGLWKSPRESGLGASVWNGKTLSAYIKKEFGIELGIRQSQRLICQLGCRLWNKPGPNRAEADPEMKSKLKT